MKYVVDLNRIRLTRERLGITKTEMASLLGLSGTEKYTRRETGEYNFKATEIPVLSAKLKLPMEKILVSSLRKSKN
ncbi:helix-turn-helix domain-containing protein [Lacticaseibacillus saniviri]|uniref:helix-turn-helix domain-containing protein n=1 Tax=Lacticaseibacillus saniviri TaxID=931533 RepID=UPI001EDEB3C3|nr:helix-turn-helix domain-containing protein [Lacticaseibacillus saniviri]MCG4280878.1 helix-turn-helix domain-containing protein [Lacticaseibacillus saniviri]